MRIRASCVHSVKLLSLPAMQGRNRSLPACRLHDAAAAVRSSAAGVARLVLAPACTHAPAGRYRMQHVPMIDQRAAAK